MQGQSYQVKTVLEQYNARKKTFLAFKDSPGNPLGRSPKSNLFLLNITWGRNEAFSDKSVGKIGLAPSETAAFRLTTRLQWNALGRKRHRSLLHISAPLSLSAYPSLCLYLPCRRGRSSGPRCTSWSCCTGRRQTRGNRPTHCRNCSRRI